MRQKVTPTQWTDRCITCFGVIPGCNKHSKAFSTFLHEKSSINLEQSVLTDSDLTDTAVESSSRDIVAATAGLMVYDRRKHLIWGKSSHTYPEHLSTTNASIFSTGEDYSFSHLYSHCCCNGCVWQKIKSFSESHSIMYFAVPTASIKPLSLVLFLGAW